MKPHLVKSDKIFIFTIATLTASGLLMLSSASVAISQKAFGTIYFFSLRQLFAVLTGLFAFFLIQLVPYSFWKKTAVFWIILAVILMLVIILTPLGFASGGATRWLQIGSLINFQPSELAKLAFVIMLAWWFDMVRRADSFSQGFLPVLAATAVMGALLMMQPDLGTFLIIAATAFVMYFAAGGSVRYSLLFIILGIIAFLALAWFAPYRFDRIVSYLNPEADPLGQGYQVRQAAIAIGSGGFWGTGYGSSLQKQGLLPEPIGDSIFAVIAEEFGFLRVMMLLILYLLFLWRGLVIARAAPDFFSKLVVTGIITSIVAQAFVNMGSISGLLPLTGIPLPFISYGGTSIVATFAGLGIVFQIMRKSITV